MSEKVSVIRANRKTMSLRVTEDGSLEVRAPLWVTDAHIAAFLKEKAAWIASVREKKAAKEENYPSDFEKRKTALFFGQSCRIEEGAPRYEGGILYLPKGRRRDAYFALLKSAVTEFLIPRAEALSARYGIRAAAFRAGTAKGSFGSCKRDGIIRFSAITAELPPFVQEYIVTHELAHIRHHDHGAAFWDEVRRLYPDTDRAKAWIKAHRDEIAV